MLCHITPQMRLCDFEQPATFANVNQHIFRRMKTKSIFAFTVAVFLSVSAFAVGGGAGSTTFTIKTSKVGRSLVEAWTKAYMAEHPEVNIQIVGTKAADADLTLINHKEKNQKVAYVARYALLPVTTSGNPLLSEIEKKAWSSKDLKELFFTADELDDDFADDDILYDCAVLSGDIALAIGAPEGGDPRAFWIWVRDLEGNTVFKGEFPQTQFLKELGIEQNYSISDFMGDRNAIYVCFTDDDISEEKWNTTPILGVVRYEIVSPTELSGHFVYKSVS